MYAIVQVGGRQYRAVAGERLVVDRLEVEPGSRVHLSDVRMLIAEEGDGTETEIGRPRVADVAVAARAISHFRGPKILVFKYKPKKRYRRHQGFRAELTELRIEEVRRGAYEDKPAPEAAKKRAPARSSRTAAIKAATAPVEVSEPSTKAAAEATKVAVPSRSKAVPAAKVAATSRAGREAAAKEAVTKPKGKAEAASVAEKPKPTRAARKPAETAPTPPVEKKSARPRTKSGNKQEQPDGS
ncbi:MAG: 50S ribosomal protein L21 [Candidatus Dormiibacterota bacterium]